LAVVGLTRWARAGERSSLQNVPSSIHVLDLVVVGRVPIPIDRSAVVDVV